MSKFCDVGIAFGSIDVCIFFATFSSCLSAAGWYEVDAKVRKFDLDIHDPLTISAKEDWTLRSADLIQSVSIDSFNVKYDGQALGKHPGAAFAVGLFHHTSQWQFGLQVRDLGWISWEGKAYSRKAETNYSGERNSVRASRSVATTT